MFNGTKPFKFHSWNKWETVKEGSLTSDEPFYRERVVGSFVEQQRTCKECSIVKKRKLVISYLRR